MTANKTESPRKAAKRQVRLHGNRFAYYLNSKMEVARAYRTIVESALAIAKFERPPWTRLPGARWKAYLRETTKQRRRIRKAARWIAKMYPSQFNMVGEAPRFYMAREPLRSGSPHSDRWLAATLEWDFETLVARGELLSVRHCALDKCGRYFFVGRRGQIFCSRPCSQKDMRQTEEWKKKNRKHWQ